MVQPSDFPPPTLGDERQWIRCKTCHQVSYYDYLPHSLSRPLFVMSCGHDVGCRQLSNVADRITEGQAMALLNLDVPVAEVQEMGHQVTSLGDVLYIRISTPDKKPLSWKGVYETYARAYPTRWAVQFFPPLAELVDEENIYHLYVLDHEPGGVNINRKGP